MGGPGVLGALFSENPGVSPQDTSVLAETPLLGQRSQGHSGDWR